MLLRLNEMLYYALCLSYYSNTKSVLFAGFSSGWATTTGRLLAYQRWARYKIKVPRYRYSVLALKSTSVPVLETFFIKYRGTVLGTVLFKILCNNLYPILFLNDTRTQKI